MDSSSCGAFCCFPAIARCFQSLNHSGKFTLELPECFSFLWAKPQNSWSEEKSVPTQLPELDDACKSVKASCWSFTLTCRRRQVLAKLLPAFAHCAVDLCRPRGPKYAVANTRRLRLSLEALGPAFVKLGQAAASREDVLSDEVAAELRKLCDQVPPFPSEDALCLIRQELGNRAPSNIGEVVAAASLGQVYRVTVAGKDYAMKVQRPGLAKALAIDVVILKDLAKFMRFFVRLFCETGVDPVKVVQDWAETLWNELDYNLEARSSESTRHALCGSIKGLVIPTVCWDLTSLHILTSEWIEGEKVTDQPRCVTKTHIGIGVETFAAMILDIGLVHADPHAGNMIIIDSDNVCLLDFGMVINVPAFHRKAWAKMIVHMVRRDHNAVLDDLVEIGFFPRDCSREQLLPVMSKIWDQLVECGSDIHKRKVAVRLLWGELLIFVRKFKFGLPDYYVALGRALVTLEGIALAADCNFDIFQVLFPVALRYLSSQSMQNTRSLGAALATSCYQDGGSLSVALATSQCKVLFSKYAKTALILMFAFTWCTYVLYWLCYQSGRTPFAITWYTA